MNDHLFATGESLAEVAVICRLSGWQGLYYADVNRGFRERYPDPWDIPGGARISVPGCAAEQRAALLSRIRTLDSLLNEVKAIGAEQLALLKSALARAALDDPEKRLGPFMRGLVYSILRSIRLLNESEGEVTRANLALTDDALHRWALASRTECASMLSLLVRAALGASWTVPQVAARGWCDAASPHFWGRPLVPTIAGLERPDRDPGQLLRQLHCTQEVALARVLQQLVSLRTDAMMELNRLARQEYEDES